MSNLPTVAVMVGAPAVPHLTLVKVAVVAEPEAGCLSNKVNDLPAVAVGIVNVQGVAEVKVAVKIVPAVIAKVADAPTVPLATIVSVYAVGVKLVDEVSVVKAPVLGVVDPIAGGDTRLNVAQAGGAADPAETKYCPDVPKPVVPDRAGVVPRFVVNPSAPEALMTCDD
jgi:hypothetical protein